MSEVINNNFYAANEKIADISESDTNKHTLDLAGIVPVNTVALLLQAYRMGGSGSFYAYSNEGIEATQIGNGKQYQTIVSVVNHRLQYRQTTSNDDWDLYIFGYFVEGRR